MGTERSSAEVHPEGLDRERVSIERSSAEVHPEGLDRERVSIERSSAEVHPEGLDRERVSIERSSAEVHPEGLDREKGGTERSSAEVHPEGLDREKGGTERSSAEVHPEGLDREKGGTERSSAEVHPEGLDREKVSREHIVLLAIVALAAAVYRPALGGKTLDWDDPVWLTDPLLAMPLPEAVSTAFTTSHDHVWSPMLRLSFWSLQFACGEHAGPKHAFVVLLFLASIPLVHRMLTALGLPIATSLASTALWALHPSRVESVAWLTGLKDVQSLVLMLGAGALLIPRDERTPSGARVVLGTVFGAGALLTKAAVFPIPFVLAVLAFSRPSTLGCTRALGRSVLAFSRASPSGCTPALARSGALGPLCVLSLVAAGIGALLWTPSAWPALPRWQLPLWVHGVFWRTIVDPSPAAVVALPEHPVPIIVVGVLFTGCMIVWAWLRPATAGPLLALWLLPQVPFLGLAPMAFWGSSRHMLYPSLAIAIIAVLALEKISAPRPRVFVPLVGVLLLAESAATARRVGDWHDSRTLWESEVARSDEHWVRWMKVGTVRGIDGDFRAAEEAFDRALALEPDRDTLARRLIASLAADGWTAADASLASLLQPPPSGADAWQSAVASLRQAGREDLADFADDVLRRARER